MWLAKLPSNANDLISHLNAVTWRFFLFGRIVITHIESRDAEAVRFQFYLFIDFGRYSTSICDLRVVQWRVNYANGKKWRKKNVFWNRFTGKHTIIEFKLYPIHSAMSIRSDSFATFIRFGVGIWMDWIVSTAQSIYCVLFVFPQRWRDGDRVFHRHSNLNICNFIVVYNNIRMDSKYVPSTILGIKDLSIRSSLHFFFVDFIFHDSRWSRRVSRCRYYIDSCNHQFVTFSIRYVAARRATSPNKFN